MEPEDNGSRPSPVQSGAYPRPATQRVSTIPVQHVVVPAPPRDFSLKPFMGSQQRHQSPEATSLEAGPQTVSSQSPRTTTYAEDKSGDSLESEPVIKTMESSALESDPRNDHADRSELPVAPKSDRFSLFRLNRLAISVTASVIVAILLIGGGTLFLAAHHANGGQSDDQRAASYAPGTSLKLNEAQASSQLQLGESNQLTINGQLQLSDTVVVKPTARPSLPQTGQIYYDQSTNQPYYYDGKQFVSLAPQGGVTSLGGATGAIGVANGLVVTGGQLSISNSLLQQITAAGAAAANSNTISTYVASLQGQSGNVTLAAGSGISINGTAISNSGVIDLASGSPNLVISNDGAGHYTVTDTGGGSGVTSITGTANQVIVSSSTGNVTLSLPQSIATSSSPTFNNLTVSSVLGVTGNATVGGTLGVTGNVTGGTYNGAAISGGTLSGGNFTGGSVSGGTITGGTLSATGVNGLGLTSTAISGIGALSISAGGTNQSLSLQGSGTGTVVIQTPTFHNANGATYQFDSSDNAAVNATICTTVGNCAGTGGGITGSGTAGTIAMFTGTQLIANSILTQTGTTVNVGGTLAASGLLQGGTLNIAASAFQVNGSGNVTGGTYNGATITSTTFNTATISGGSLSGGSVSGGTITGGTLSGTAVNGLNVSGTAVTGSGALSISAGGINQNLSLQASGTGSVIIQTPTFHNANGATYSFNAADASSVTATICTTVGNCAGTGGGITGNGTNGTIAIFTGTGTIGNSTLTQSGSTVTASGNLAIQGANSLSLGTAGAGGHNGSVTFNNSTNSNTLTLQAGATSGNLSLTLPTADGAPGDCLETDGHGNLSFQSCTGGAGGGVTSLNGETGVLVVDNAVGTPGHITINDASTSQKGIAQFNSTNFQASSGVINTIQDIATTSAPTFAGLTVNGPTLIQTVSPTALQVTDGSNTALQVDTSGSGFIQLGNTSQDFLVDVEGTLTANRTINGAVSGAAAFSSTLTNNDASPVNQQYVAEFDNLSASGSTDGILHLINLDTVNPVGAAITIEGPGAFTNIFDNQGVLISGAELNLLDGHTVPLLDQNSNLNASNIGTGTVADARLSANVAFLNATQNFTGVNTFSSSGTALNVTHDASIGGTLTVGTLGTNGTTALCSNGGVISSCGSGGGGGNYILNGTSPQTANFNITGTGTVAGFTDNGTATVKTTSTSAFQVQNAGGSSTILNVDSSTGFVTIGGTTSAALLSLDGSGTTNGIVLGADGANSVNLYRSAANLLATDSSLSVVGSVKVGTLGLGNTSTYLCLNANSLIATCSSGGAGAAFVQGGNSFGTTATLGTADNNGLNVITDNTTVASFSSSGAATFKNASNSTTAFQVQNDGGGNLIVADTQNSRVGINTGAIGLNTNLNVYNGNPSTTQTDLTQNLAYGGINFITNYVQDAYTGGLFWSTQDNNPTSPKAGIYTQLTNNGSKLLFGTSGSYAAGITNVALTIGYKGDSVFQNGTDSSAGFQVQNASGTGVLTVDTTNSQVCIDTTSCTHALGVNGAIAASGAITASTTPDISETIPAADDVTPADVVSAGPDGNVDAVRSSVPYDPTAIGIISDGTSSFKINSNADSESADDTGKYLVLAGRVPVHVTNEGGAIEPGDYLTTSSTPGYAMKATHGGPIVGTALAAFDGTSGTVMIQTHLGYWDGPSQADYIQNGGNAVLSDLTVGGTANVADLNVSGNATLTNLTVTGSATIATLTVTGNAQFAGNITVGGHIITSGSAPTAQVQADAGSGASCTVSGNDTGGSVTIVAGSGGLADGQQCVLTFHTSFGAAPNPVIAPRNKLSAQAQAFVDADTHTMTIEFSNTPAANTTYSFNYFNTQ